MTYKMTYKISSSVHVVGYTFRGEKKGAMIVVIDDHNASIAAKPKSYKAEGRLMIENTFTT